MDVKPEVHREKEMEINRVTAIGWLLVIIVVVVLGTLGIQWLWPDDDGSIITRPCPDRERMGVYVSCLACDTCLPVIGVSTVHFKYSECPCTDMEAWMIQCRSTGNWFGASKNVCDDFIWIKRPSAPASNAPVEEVP